MTYREVLKNAKQRRLSKNDIEVVNKVLNGVPAIILDKDFNTVNEYCINKYLNVDYRVTITDLAIYVIAGNVNIKARFEIDYPEINYSFLEKYFKKRY